MAEFVDPWEEKKSSFGLGESPVKFADPWEEPEPSSLLRRGVVDPLVGLAKGVVVNVPQTALGLLDIPTMGYAGKAADVALKTTLGIGVKEAGEKFDELLSPEARLAKQKVEEAEGFVPVLKTALQYPSSIVQAAAENLPTMYGGAMIGRKVLQGIGLGIGAEGLTKAQRTGRAIAAGATGEAIITAGQNIEQVRQEAIGGTLSPGQVGINMVSAALTGLIGAAGGKLAQRFGFVDIDTLLAGGRGITPFDKATSIKGVLAKIIGGAISEGAFEELPQSMQEQIAQNLSLGKPADEGVLESGAMGMLVGALLGVFGAGVAELTPTQKRLREDPLDQEIHKQIGEMPEEEAAIKLAPPAEEPAKVPEEILGYDPYKELPRELEAEAAPEVMAEKITPEEGPAPPAPITEEEQRLVNESRERRIAAAERGVETGIKNNRPDIVKGMTKELNALKNGELDEDILANVRAKATAIPVAEGPPEGTVVARNRIGSAVNFRQDITGWSRSKEKKDGFWILRSPDGQEMVYSEDPLAEQLPVREAPPVTPEKPPSAPRFSPAGYASEGEALASIKAKKLNLADFNIEKVGERWMVTPKEAVPVPATLATKFSNLPVEEVPVEKISLSPEIPQHKRGANIKGIVTPLEGKEYQRTPLKTIILWERNDGRLEVVTGRHRLDLTQRLGEATIPAQIVKESEGFTAEMGVALDAEQNILDNQGDEYDFTTYFRTAITEADARERGLLRTPKARTAFILAKSATDQTLNAFRDGDLGFQQAAAIANAAPNDETLQLAGRNFMTKNPRATATEAENFVRALSNFEPAPQAEQGDLFGYDDTAIRTAEEQARKVAKVVGNLQKISRTINAAIKGEGKLELTPEAAKEYGIVNLNDKAQLIEARNRVQQAIARWDKWYVDPELVAQLKEGKGEPARPERKIEEEEVGEVAAEEAAPEEKAPQKEAYIGKTETAEIGGPLAPAATFELTPTETERGELKPKDRGPKTEGMFEETKAGIVDAIKSAFGVIDSTIIQQWKTKLEEFQNGQRRTLQENRNAGASGILRINEEREILRQRGLRDRRIVDAKVQRELAGRDRVRWEGVSYSASLGESVGFLAAREHFASLGYNTVPITAVKWNGCVDFETKTVFIGEAQGSQLFYTLSHETSHILSSQNNEAVKTIKESINIDHPYIKGEMQRYGWDEDYTRDEFTAAIVGGMNKPQWLKGDQSANIKIARKTSTRNGKSIEGVKYGSSYGFVQPHPPAFYSKLSQTIQGASFTKMPVPQLKAFLKGKQITDAEIENIVGGMQGTVTKQQVMDEIKVNSTEFKDVILGGIGGGGRVLRNDDMVRLRQIIRGTDNLGFDTVGEAANSVIQGGTDRWDWNNDAERDEVRRILSRKESPAHFSQYTEPGAVPGSYREMFVTAPSDLVKESGLKGPQETIRQYLQGLITGKEAEELGVSGFLPSDFGIKGRWQDGHSQYSDIQNPIVRIRYNEREVEGKRILFVEEIQGPSDANQDRMPEYLRKRIYDIGVKRVLALAKEQGFDGVAWTPGTMQAARYDLSKQIQEVTIKKWTDTNKTGITFLDNNGVRHTAGEFSDNELEGVVGKDLASKIIADLPKMESQEVKRYSGLDLKVGGEGLKRLYDVQIPALFKKYGKEGIGEVHFPAKDFYRIEKSEWGYEVMRNSDNDLMGTYGTRAGAENYINELHETKHEFPKAATVPYIPITEKTPARQPMYLPEEPGTPKWAGWTPQQQAILDEARNLQKNEPRKGYTPEEVISAYERATGEEFPYRMLVPHLNKLGVTISFNPNKIDRKNLAAAVYDPTRNQIIFNDVALPNSRDPIAKYREIISHESIHAIILNLKTVNPQVYVEMKGKLNNFLKEIELHLEKADITTRMMFEAVSEKNRAEEIINLAFTNPGFARWLDTLPSVAGAKESKTLWGKLKDIILKAIDRVANFGKTKLDELNGIMDGFFGDVITKGGVGGVTGVGEMPNIPKPIFVRTRSVGEFDERYLYDLPNLKQAIDTADTDSLLEAYRSGNIKRVTQQYDGTDYNSYYPDEDLRKAFLKQPEIIQKRLFDIARKNIKKGMGKKWDISPIDKKVIDESGDALYFAMSLAELADNPKAFLTSTAGIDVTPPTKRIGPIIKSEFTQKMLPFVRDLADRFMDKPQENIPQEDLAEFKKWYVSQKDLKWYERVFELPWTLARKHPIWRKAFQIFGIERSEIRGKLIHKFAVVAEPYLALEKNMREAGKSKAEIKDAKERLARVIITGDALLGQELKAMRRQLRTMKAGPQRDALIARIKQIETENRYSDEDLLKGIKDDQGNTVKLNKDEIEIYKSVRNSLDLMFDTYLNHIKAQSFRTYRKQKWYAILAQAADMDLTQDQTLSILKTGLNQAALLRAVKIQPDIQRIFERVEKQIASTPDIEKLAAGELYGTIADKLTKEISDLRTAIGTLTGITEDAELTDMTRGVLNAYMFTWPYLKKIKMLRNTYKKQVAFFPRVREQGPYKLKLMKRIYNKEGLVVKEQQIFMEMFGDEAGGRKIYEKIYKLYGKKGVLPDDMYIPKPDPTNATPEFAFQGVSDINMQSLLDDAIEGMKIRDVYYDEKGKKVNIQERLRDMGYQALAKQFQSRGFGRHMIHRQWNVVKGYEENNLQSVLTNYMSGMSGMMTKQIAAADFLELMKELGPGEKGHFKGLSMYGRGQLRNTSRADRIGGGLRAWAFTWVLGGVIRPAVLQFTQNYVTGIPKHAKWLRENNLGGFGKADKDYNKAMKDLVTKNLTPLEKQMQDELFTSGHTVDQYVREMFDALGNRFEQEQAKYLRWLAYPFSQMEQFNRKSAALTRFRPAYQLALKEGLSEEDAYRKAYNSAIDFIGDTHYFMGKPNLPLYAQGEGMGIALRTGLTFKSFMHNFVLQIKSDLSEGDWKTVMHQMAYIALFGGMMGLPFFKDLFEWIEKEFGYSFTKSIRQTLRSAGGKTLETFGMNGLPAMLGANMSGSLAIGIPFLGEETMATIGGVYEGQLKKLKFGAEAALRGDKYRAVLGITPEFLRSPIIAMQESEAGREMLGAPGYTTTVRGQPVWGKEGKPLSMGPYEALAKAGGFLPTEFGREKEMVQTVKRLELWATEKKQDAGERFRIARIQKNPKALKNLMEDVREINQGIRARGLQTLVPLASVQRILQSSRQIKNLKQRREQAFKRTAL